MPASGTKRPLMPMQCGSMSRISGGDRYRRLVKPFAIPLRYNSSNLRSSSLVVATTILPHISYGICSWSQKLSNWARPVRQLSALSEPGL